MKITKKELKETIKECLSEMNNTVNIKEKTNKVKKYSKNLKEIRLPKTLEWDYDEDLTKNMDAAEDDRNVALVAYNRRGKSYSAFLGKDYDSDKWNIYIGDEDGKTYYDKEFESFEKAEKFFDKIVL